MKARNYERADVLECWDDWRFPVELASSFLFARIRFRLVSAPWFSDPSTSVGNANFLLVSPVFPIWRRFRGATQVPAGIECVLNPHTGAVHDLARAGEAHMAGLWKTANALALPGLTAQRMRQMQPDELVLLVARLVRTGSDARIEGGHPTWEPPRQDHYEGFPPPRLERYWATHAENAASWKRRNGRTVHRCQRCFR